jgi:hypothetical protein
MAANQSAARSGSSGGNQGGSRRRASKPTQLGVVERGVQTVRDKAARQAAEVGQRIKERGGQFLDEQKRRAAEELGGIGSSVRQAAGQLSDGPLEAVGGYVETAAESLDRVARYLGERDLAGLVEDTDELARRRPAWFLGGMFVAGIALARFLKASQSRALRDDDEDERGNDGSRRRGSRSSGQR